MIWWAALLACILAMPAAAQQSVTEQAEAALAQLEAASVQLTSAKGARHRVRALTETIQALETGLAAVRESQRATTTAEQVLSARLEARDGETARFLGNLQAVGRTDSPTVFLHPDGATGTARAAMLLAEIGPVLHARAAELRQDVSDLRDLQNLQSAAATRIGEGLNELRAAREALNKAVADRTDLPKRFVADPVRQAILLASTETLEGFASGLMHIVPDGVDPSLPGTDDLPIGELPAPVLGIVLRAAGEADLAGVKRPGVVMATRPEAIVTAPAAATIRYSGPLLDFGQVVILEPRAGSLLIFAGLGQGFGTTGQVVAAGEVLGMMGHPRHSSGAVTSTGGEGTGTDLSQTLYIEVRQDNAPVDPTTWFALGEDKQESR